MLYLLRDDLIGDERLAALREALGPPDVQSLNLSILDGPRLTVSELRAAAEALPFFGDRRMVIVRRLFGATGRAEAANEGPAPRRGARADAERDQQFLAYLPSIPPTTDIVLVEDHDFKPDHPAAKLVARLGGEVQPGGMPRWDELAQWIEHRVRDKGGRIDQAAARELSGLSVDDLRQFDLLLDTLVTYTDDRPITSADLQTMVQASREVTVFELVDAVGARDRRSALSTYRRLLADNVSPIYLLVMLTRQIRLLLLAHDAQARHENVGATLKVHPRVAQKLAQQVRSFSIERCLDAYQRLAAVDQAIK
ncbi:MAG: DNA polymerase III subunit delta, partial [Chloroflexota bacterium]